MSENDETLAPELPPDPEDLARLRAAFADWSVDENSSGEEGEIDAARIFDAVQGDLPPEERLKVIERMAVDPDAALAVVASLLVGGLVYRELDWTRLREAIIDGAVQTGTVMLLVAASALLGLYLTEVQLPQRIAAAMLSVTSEKWAILAILNVFFLIIGMFLHSAAAIILVVPIVMPVVTAAGIDPVHFGVIVTLNLAIGQQTPPVASVLLLTCSIAKESVWDVTKANIPFIGVLLATLLLVTYVPVVTLGLVSLFYR